MKKRGYFLSSLMVVVAMVLTMMPITRVNAQEDKIEYFQDYDEYSYDSFEEAVAASENPMSSEELELLEDGSMLYDEADSVNGEEVPTFSTIDEGVVYLREKMHNRQYKTEFKFENTNNWDSSQVYDYIKKNIFVETDNCKEGDYLRWNCTASQVGLIPPYYDQTFTVICYQYYHSTLEQEAAVDAKVDSLLNKEFAGWENMCQYDRVNMVNNWVKDNITYAKDKYGPRDVHSTYSAIIERDTVCQGYATTMYRLLREMNISTRIVCGDNHAWNIVKIGNKYYNLDATWDDSLSSTRYFLTCNKTFQEGGLHNRYSEYNTAEFNSRYPMSSQNYSIKNYKASGVSVTYKTHVQSYGWQDYVRSGATSGTVGKSKRLEGIRIKLQNNGHDLGIMYRTHIQSYGWENSWKSSDQFSGTEGKGKRLEAIQINLTGGEAGLYDVYYRVHAQSYGWLGWAKNGETAGTIGMGKRLEGIQIVVVPKGITPSGNIGNSYVDSNSNQVTAPTKPTKGLVNYKTHVQTYGWQGYVYDGTVSGTYGHAKRLEGIRIELGDTGYEGGIQYTTHVQTYGWQGDKENPDTWVKDGQMSGTEGEAKRLEGIRIKLYGEVAEHYDIYYRVHAQTYGWLDWACNGGDAGTAGLAKRLEAIQIVLVPKGGEAPGSTAVPFISK